MRSMNGVYAFKCGMTRIAVNNNLVAATVLRIPKIQQLYCMDDNRCKVAIETDYRRMSQPELGQLNKANVEVSRGKGYIREVGKDFVDWKSVFQEGDLVDVSAKNIGKGFQGVMKRHGFGGGRASHGETKAHRSGGSTGSQGMGKVQKGKKMPGNMGNKNITVEKLKILKIDRENDLIVVKGSTPGHKATFGAGQYFSFIRPSKKIEQRRLANEYNKK